MNNINRKYTNEIVKEKLLEYGYHLCSDFISIKKDVQFYDNDGYRYCCPLMDLFHENKIEIQTARAEFSPWYRRLIGLKDK